MVCPWYLAKPSIQVLSVEIQNNDFEVTTYISFMTSQIHLILWINHLKSGLGSEKHGKWIDARVKTLVLFEVILTFFYSYMYFNRAIFCETSPLQQS
jgi:hypothetical protein